MNRPAKISAETLKPEPISAEELDRRFDDGEDVSAYFDWSKAKVVGMDRRRVNIDLPQWMVNRLDREAAKRGVSRQALIKMWLADRLEAAG